MRQVAKRVGAGAWLGALALALPLVAGLIAAACGDDAKGAGPLEITDVLVDVPDPDRSAVPTSAFAEPIEGVAVSTSIRVVVNQLLDPDIEDLTAAGGPALIADVATVTVGTTSVVLPTSGFYDPTGDAVNTVPPGPALVITLGPGAFFPSDTEITVTLNGALIKDKRGNPLGGAPAFRFRTEPFRVLAQEPADVEGDGGVESAEAPVDGDVVWSFTAPFDPASLEAVAGACAAASLADCHATVLQPDGTAVPGELVLDEEEPFGLAFTPADPLAGGTTFTGRVTTDVTDLSGVPLAEELAQPFTTEASDAGGADAAVDGGGADGGADGGTDGGTDAGT